MKSTKVERYHVIGLLLAPVLTSCCPPTAEAVALRLISATQSGLRHSSIHAMIKVRAVPMYRDNVIGIEVTIQNAICPANLPPMHDERGAGTHDVRSLTLLPIT